VQGDVDKATGKAMDASVDAVQTNAKTGHEGPGPAKFNQEHRPREASTVGR
jgi:hypothetical protein